MSTRHPDRPTDEARIRRPSRQIGLLVGLSSAVVIATGVATLLAVIRVSARPERGKEGFPADLDHVVIDVDDFLPWLIGFGVITVLVLGLIAWLAARRSVRPLADALRAQRAFVADASHELRTPLTALVSRVQIVERRLARGEPIEEVVAKLRDDAEAMSETLTDLLTVAAAEHTSAAADQPAADPGTALRDALDRLAPIAEMRGVRLVHDAGSAERARVPVPQAALTRACVVLIDNAVNHSLDGGTVTARYSVSPDLIRIRVEDHGSGIPPGEESRIFERFSRGSETGHRRGFGLGLFLAREIAERAGGTVRVEQSSPEGTVFLLEIPRVA